MKILLFLAFAAFHSFNFQPGIQTCYLWDGLCVPTHKP